MGFGIYAAGERNGSGEHRGGPGGDGCGEATAVRVVLAAASSGDEQDELFTSTCSQVLHPDTAP